MKKPLIPIVALAAAGALFWVAKTVLYNQAHESTDNAQVDGSIVPVLAKVGGYVTQLAVNENQPVKQEDLLVRIDTAEYAMRLAQAQAEYDAAASVAGSRAFAGQADALLKSAESQRQVVAAQIDAARAQVAKASADLARAKELAAKQIVSRQALDAAQSAYEQATASLQAVERQARSADAQATGAQAGTRLAQARLAAARATLDNAKLQLAYTTVRAPLTGVVSKKQVEVGQLVSAGQPLLTLVDAAHSWVTANFKETQLSDMRVGQTVALEVDSYPDCDAEGKVESLSAATGARFALLPPDNATGNFTKVVQRVPVRIAITKDCGADRPLRPGMSVVAHVNVK
ncbi:MAG: HlyD family secretion protein [Gemmatimonadaceae bacterium]|nr:HlyD family secretion protein [Gemmatimonadaceae bacterium]